MVSEVDQYIYSLPPDIVQYTNTYNPVPENTNAVKILDDFVRDLDFDATFSIQHSRENSRSKLISIGSIIRNLDCS